MIQLIKSAEGFRIGNFVFVDEFVFPPNFIVASPKILVEGFEAILNKEKNNIACLNADEKWMDFFLQTINNNNRHLKMFHSFGVEKVQESGFEKFPIWKISCGEKTAEISFIHQLQNYYEDWTGVKL